MNGIIKSCRRNLSNLIVYFFSDPYDLKHKVEKSFEGHHIYNGELIAAMILKGHPARFAKRGQALDVNCQFKARFIDA